MSYAAAVLADAPVVFLQLDETSGTVAADSGSNAVAWTYQTGVSLAQTPAFSVGGYGVKPSGSAAAAILSSVPASLANPRGTSMELSVVLPDLSQKGAFIKVGDASTGWGVGVGNGNFDNPGNNLVVLQENRGWYDSGKQMSTGAHHIVVTNDVSGTIRFYFDGVLIKTTSGTTSPLNAGAQMSIGGYSTRSISNTVTIDNVALYGAVLSDAQVAAHWQEISVTLPSSNSVMSRQSVAVATTASTPGRVVSRTSAAVAANDLTINRTVSWQEVKALSNDTVINRTLSHLGVQILIPTAPRFRGWGARR
jgi:hypothetical protein